MYSETTSGIVVSVEPIYLEDQSEPDDNHYVWAYTVTISNEGNERVQLLNRHWQITNGAGKQQEVRGPGVVGEQPVLEPGQSYKYTSGCPLGTPSGFMVGAYEMTRDDGSRFKVRIPMFSLDSPYVQTKIH
ncbi:MAG: Co2+/Mg2+ efflux protein ApaG [Rhodospirillaceae bacterium]|nr:Co2+/Mg2+ efflux protein ApaG [Rhodospirillaceae bacterium]MCY4310693.1 Co2+/Mg2+ efflux protein ApaG [Rhodospirillaceae bacterium]